MPIEIVCPECEGCGGNTHFPCNDCERTGKITVYTEEELQESIKQEKEECALICDSYAELSMSALVMRQFERCAEQIRSKE